MESATLTRPRPDPVWLARLRSVPASTWAKLAFVLLCAGALAGFFAYPTYPTYDSYYALIWGRDLLHLHLPVFQVYRAPTEHPLAIAFGVLMSVFGQAGDRLMILGAIGSFVALVAGVYRLGRVTFGAVVGFAAAGLLLTRFNYEYLAAQGYLDFSYMALVVWAGALEAERLRRGASVLVLLALAGLLRPEAWLLSVIYLAWWAWPELGRWYRREGPNWRRLLGYGALAVAGPVLWAGLDTIVTGHPTYSLHSTRGLAEDLGRTQGLANMPAATWQFMVKLDKLPLVLGAIAGLALSVWLVPRRVLVPLVLLVSGVFAFVMIGASGGSVIDRYLLTPAVLVMLFCAVAVGGWSLLAGGGWLRRVWIAAATLLVVYGAVSAATTVNLSTIRYDLAFRDQTHIALRQVLDTPTVRRDLRACGPLSLPNHKLAPDARWILGVGPGPIVARSQARADAARGRAALARRISRGVAIYPLGDAVFTQAVVDLNDNPLDQVPMRGFQRVLTSSYYSIYVRC
jgi:hypothetical protein